MKRTEPSVCSIKIRPSTRAKWDVIRRQKRWSWIETADALADAFLRSEGMDADGCVTADHDSAPVS